MNVHVLENKLQGNSLLGVPTLQAALSDLPQNEATSALLEIAENAEQKRRSLERKALVTMTLFLLFWVVRLPLIFTPLQHKTWFQVFNALLNVVPLIGVNLSGFFFSPRKVVQTQQNAVAALILCHNETRFLPHLVDGLYAGKAPEWKTLLYPALTAALWEAKEDDLVLRLDAPRRNALRAFVAYEFPSPLFPRSKTQVSPHFDDATTDLTLAAMRTLVSLGDKKTVKVLDRIIKTEGNLRNESVVRDAAREFLPVLQKRIAENEEIFRRLRILAGDQTENPYAAIEKYVDTLPQETVSLLLAAYLIEQKRNAAQSRLFATVGLAAVVAGATSVYFLLNHRENAGWFGVFGLIVGMAANLCLSILRQPTGEMQAGKIACELAKRCGDDTRLLPVLLHALRPVVDKKQSEAVEKAILHLLPFVRLGDAALIPPATRRFIRAWLTMPRGALGRAAKNRAIIAIDALAAIGDRASLRRVEAVANYAETARHGDFLRQTATRCADALKARKPQA